MKNQIFFSNSDNPWLNLAIEELLLDTVEENQFILYLWQNQNTIVLGKNQNPWKECRSVLLEKEGGYLARRLSGGGTVYHDLGNLNFTMLMNRTDFNLEKQAGVILTAVRALGIPAEMTGRNDLTIEGRKFSGNAFCFRKNNAYHHGTILVASDFEKLTRYLQVPKEKIRSKGIESVRARVVNLTDYSPLLKINTMKDLLCEEFSKVYGGDPRAVQSTDQLNQAVIQQHYQKYASWKWRYGDAPKFDLELSTRFSWGGIDIGLKLEQGIVISANAYSDAMDAEFIGMIPEALKGSQLNAALLAERINTINAGDFRKSLQEDIVNWLRTKEL